MVSRLIQNTGQPCHMCLNAGSLRPICPMRSGERWIVEDAYLTERSGVFRSSDLLSPDKRLVQVMPMPALANKRRKRQQSRLSRTIYVPVHLRTNLMMFPLCDHQNNGGFRLSGSITQTCALARAHRSAAVFCRSMNVHQS